MNTTEEILRLKARFGSELLILGHHYQRHAIVQVADVIGDSFGLAQKASQAEDARHIVFCGVRFMAESAAILCRDDQRVFHPEPEAGCPMADMAPMDAVETAWRELTERPDFPRTAGMLPVTYMNSHAPLKSFTGREGGLVCTSSNAEKAMAWAWERSKILLFFPDQHLGRNTALRMGLREDEMVVWYPSKPGGGIESLEGVKLILWNGHCPVHVKFHARDVKFVRQHWPEAKIFVHPECPREVLDLADGFGSTEYLARVVQSLAPKTKVFLGTEIQMVDRLKRENPQIQIEALFRSLCPTMYMLDMPKLLETLQMIDQGVAESKRVEIVGEEKNHARVALERMLDLPRA